MQRLASPVLSALLRPHASVQRVFPCVSMSVLPSSMGVRALSTVDKPPVTFKLNDLRDNSGAWQNVRAPGAGCCCPRPHPELRCCLCVACLYRRNVWAAVRVQATASSLAVV